MKLENTRLIKKIQQIPVIIVLLLIIVCAISLIFYLADYESNFVSKADTNRYYLFEAGRYATYSISFITLVITVIKIPALWIKVKNWAFSIEFIDAFFHNQRIRIKFGLVSGVLMNLIYGLIKMLVGYQLSSLWFFSIGAFYIILFLIRLWLLVMDEKCKKITAIDQKNAKALICFKITGLFLIILTIAMSRIFIQMVRQQQAYFYPYYLIYGVAVFTFYFLIYAIIQVIKTRKIEDPIVSAVRNVSLSSAIMSLVALQTAMISTFGDVNTSFSQKTNALTCGIAFVFMLIMSISMLLKVNAKPSKPIK